MGKIIVDTDVLIDFLRKNEKVANFLIEDIGFENIAITYITLIELIKGATNKRNLKIIESVLSDFPILHHTKNSSEATCDLIRTYHLSHNLKLPDGSIAAISIANNMPLLTMNTKDFIFIENLKLVSHQLKPKQ